jgi:hypothetical protein
MDLNQLFYEFSNWFLVNPKLAKSKRNKNKNGCYFPGKHKVFCFCHLGAKVNDEDD